MNDVNDLMQTILEMDAAQRKATEKAKLERTARRAALDEQKQKIVAECNAREKAEAEAAAPAEETAPAEEPAAPETEAAPAEAAEPVPPPDLSEERPVCDPEAPNPNPVEAGPAGAPKDENGKCDPTKIADVSDFGDWEEQGCRG